MKILYNVYSLPKQSLSDKFATQEKGKIIK